MKKNMGSIDRVIRVLIAAAVGALLVTGQTNETLAVVLGLVAVIFLLTSAVGFCPLYAIFRLKTKKDAKQTA